MLRLTLATVRESGSTKKRSDAAALTEMYLERCKKMTPTEWIQVRSVADVMKLRERAASYLVLLDSRGKQRTSEAFAEKISTLREGGKRELILAIGPADGWSADDLERADETLSLGKMTLPHELAATVLAEQMYRACTILAGHPYHCGH